jgi:hypothetical protein
VAAVVRSWRHPRQACSARPPNRHSTKITKRSGVDFNGDDDFFETSSNRSGPEAVDIRYLVYKYRALDRTAQKGRRSGF